MRIIFVLLVTTMVIAGLTTRARPRNARERAAQSPEPIVELTTYPAYTVTSSPQQRNPVITSRHSVVLGSVLCLSIAGTPAQDIQHQEALVAMLAQGTPDSEAIAKHRLTVENVRRMFAVDRELLPLMKNPDLERRADELAKSLDPQRRMGVVAVDAKIYEAIPEIAEILRRHRISGREYTLTHLVAMVTAMADDTLAGEARHEGVNDIPLALMTPALKFWRSMDPALKAEAAGWKRMQGYDKGINR